MRNPNIGTTLRTLRKNSHLSVEEVSNILQEHNNFSAPKTIYGWETGRTQPDADTLMFLCDLYQVDNILETFGYKNEDNVLETYGYSQEEEFALSLSEKEKALVLSYRQNPNMQNAVDKLLDIEKYDITQHRNVSYLNISRE
ncbi:MAG: helix-turn-helix domain-containing protein [Lachnospiraceae bacterium]|nr:helix-turn-helix domain-containing protein [Lachnospiraceae bacterium]